MSCALTLSAYKRGCATPSGIDSIYLIDHEARKSSEAVFVITNGALTITNAGAGVPAFHVEPVFNTSTVTTPITSDATSNAFKYDRNLEFKLDGYDASIVTLTENLVKGRTEVLIKWVNGTYTYMGNERGCSATGSDAGTSGTALADAKGVTITLMEEAIQPMPIVTFSEFSSAFTITEPV
tara:strand:- start:3776 stop:4318 length:543 start_codon:yes stop_codon:yes gene_type:complete